MKPSLVSVLALLFVFALALAACTPSVSAQPGDLNALAASLDSDMPRLLNTYQVPGATIAIVQDGKVAWSKGYGLADKENVISASPATIYQIASISKTVAAWGVMRLVEQGKLDLDAPASQYLTRWKLPSSAFDSSEVTIRRLLSHSAGLSVHGYPGYAPDAPLPSVEESLSGVQGPNYAVQMAMEPGSIFSYSGGGYTLLQLIIEEVSGQSFADFMDTEVFAPLGMKHSSYIWREDLRAQTAKAYDSQSRRLPNYLFTEQAAAGLYTTAGDLALFGAAYVTSPAGGLSEASIAEIEQVAIAIPPNSPEGFLSGMDGYGLGCYIETLPDGSKAISHTGGNKGWRSLLMIVPQQKAALVVLTNSDNGFGLHEEIRGRWANWLGAGRPKGLQHVDLLTRLVIGASVLLILGFGWWVYRFARAVIHQQRRFRFKPDLRQWSGWKFVLGLLAAVFLAALWFTLGSLLVGAIFPLQTGLVGLAALLWTLALALNSVTVRA